MNPGFLFPFLHCQSRLQFLDWPTWTSQPDWMPGWRFSAILPTSSLYSTSSFWTTVVRIVELSAVLTGTSLFAPAALFPGCGHENLRSSSFTSPRLNDSHLSPQISHACIDRSWCLLALLLTQTIPTQTSFIFICIYGHLCGHPRNNSDTFLGNAIHKVEKNTTFF